MVASHAVHSGYQQDDGQYDLHKSRPQSPVLKAKLHGFINIESLVSV